MQHPRRQEAANDKQIGGRLCIRAREHESTKRLDELQGVGEPQRWQWCRSHCCKGARGLRTQRDPYSLRGTRALPAWLSEQAQRRWTLAASSGCFGSPCSVAWMASLGSRPPRDASCPLCAARGAGHSSASESPAAKVQGLRMARACSQSTPEIRSCAWHTTPAATFSCCDPRAVLR